MGTPPPRLVYRLIVSAGVTFFTRGDPAAKKGGGSPSVALLLSAALWTAAVTATILTTERDSRVHTVARGVLTCTFSLLLVSHPPGSKLLQWLLLLWICDHPPHRYALIESVL
jgi:hypothetical protein